MAGSNDFTGQNIQDTYQRVLQLSSSGQLADGTGSLVPLLKVTASFAISASHEITFEISSSHAQTASFIPGLTGTNSGDVTLTGTPDYITISGQEITRNQIDLANDVTGILPSANLDSDTAHLTTDQTFSGKKTFSAAITASGNISASGEVQAKTFGLTNGDVTLKGDRIDITSDTDGTIDFKSGLSDIVIIGGFGAKVTGHITASGDISASGDVYATDLYVGGQQFTDVTVNENIFGIGTLGQGSLQLKNITASGNISSSGTLIGNALTLSGLSNQGSEATAVVIDGSNIVGTRELGSNAFTSTTIGTMTNALTVDNATLQLDSGTTFDGSAAKTISVKDGGIDSDALAANIAVTELSASAISGTLETVAQPNITSVGTLSSLTVSGDITANGNIDGDGSTDITNINSIEIGTDIIHDGDPDTKINFSNDSITTSVGGSFYITLSGANQLITLGKDTSITGDASITGDVSASNISASGHISGSVANFGGTHISTGGVKLKNLTSIKSFDNTGTERILAAVNNDEVLLGSLALPTFVRGTNIFLGNNTSPLGAPVTASVFSASGDLIGGGLNINGAITASGDISGSINSTFTAASGSYHILQGDTSQATGLEIDGFIKAQHITASGNISSSGHIIASRIYGNADGAFITTANGQIQSSTGFAGTNITASGNISASGDIVGASLNILSNTSGLGYKISEPSTDNLLFAAADGGGFTNFSFKSQVTVQDEFFSAAGMTHEGDTDTKITFGTDQITLTAGNVDMITLDENGNDILTFGNVQTKFEGHITASGNISSSGDVISLNLTTDSIKLEGNRFRIENDNFDIMDGGLEVNGNVTASGDISSSAGSILSVPRRHLDQTAQNTVGSDAQGDIVYFTDGGGSGISTTAGLVYALATNGNLFAVDKDTENISTGLIAVAIGDNSLTDGMLLRGMVKLSHDPFPGGEAAIGKAVYIGDSGQLTGSIDGFATDDFIRIAGYEMESGGVIYFNPDNTFIKKA